MIGLHQQEAVMDGYIGYIRVSAVKGREEGGEGALEQREAILAWEASRDVEILEWAVDLDKSGGQASRPELNKAIRRIEDGEADGIVVAKLNRLSRLKRFAAFELIDKIDSAGGKFAALDFGLDPTTPQGEMMLTMMLGIARMDHRTLGEGLANSKARRRKEGVHLAPAPLGYTRPEKNAKLVPDDAAPLVRECFLMRARGSSWMELVRYLESHGHRVSKSAVGYMLTSRTYLGEIQGGEEGVAVHEAIVTQEEWDAAQGVGRGFARDGTIAAEGILSGLITCTACGGRLMVGRSGAMQPDGKRGARYGCKGHSSAKGKCPAPASANVSAVDDYVEAAITQAITDGTLRATLDAVERYNAACRAVDQAQADLDAHKANAVRLVQSIGADGYAETAEALKAVLDEAKRSKRDTPRPEDTLSPDTHWGTDLWPVDEKRRLTKQLISKVTLARSTTRGRNGQPIEQRISITWAGHDGPDSTVAQRIAETRETAARLIAA
jgi:DNA invertase Pin-like site-specific DNA recombinase